MAHGTGDTVENESKSRDGAQASDTDKNFLDSRKDYDNEIHTYFKVPSPEGQPSATPRSPGLGDIVRNKDDLEPIADKNPPQIDKNLIFSYPKIVSNSKDSKEILRVRHFSPTRDYILRSVQEKKVKDHFGEDYENAVAFMITGLVTKDTTNDTKTSKENVSGGAGAGTAQKPDASQVIVAVRLKKLSYRRLFGVFKHVLIIQNYIKDADYTP